MTNETHRTTEGEPVWPIPAALPKQYQEELAEAEARRSPTNAQCKCGATIYLDKWGAWRHYDTGVMLCHDESVSVDVAEPAYTDAELEAFEDHEWHEDASMHPDCPHC